MTNDDFDFDAPQKLPDDLHLRINTPMPTPEEREELERRKKALAPPPPIRSSVTEEKRLAADPTTPPERKRLALAVLKTYSATYAEMSAHPEIGMLAKDWWHFESTLAVLREHRVSLDDEQ